MRTRNVIQPETSKTRPIPRAALRRSRFMPTHPETGRIAGICTSHGHAERMLGTSRILISWDQNREAQV